MRTAIPLLTLLLFTSTLAAPSQAQRALAESLIVTPVGLTLVADGGILLERLSVDGGIPQLRERAIAPGTGSTPLGDRAIEERVPVGGGKRDVLYTLSWNGVEALRVEGALERDPETLHFTARVATLDPRAPFRLAQQGPAILLEQGHHEDELTLLIAWRDAAPTGWSAEVVTDRVGVEVATLGTRPVSSDGKVMASRHMLRYLPLTLDVEWQATIEADGRRDAVTGAEIFFPSKSAREGYFDNDVGTGIEAVAGMHNLTKRTVSLGLPVSLLQPYKGGEKECDAGGIYDTAFGQLHLLTPYMVKAGGCEAARPPVLPPAPALRLALAGGAGTASQIVSADVRGFTLLGEGVAIDGPARGFIAYALDGQPLGEPTSRTQITVELSEGPHTFAAELVDAAGAPLDPRVSESIGLSGPAADTPPVVTLESTSSNTPEVVVPSEGEQKRGVPWWLVALFAAAIVLALIVASRRRR